MLLRDVIKISMASLTRNKSRAALTMLGIIIGISSVILMMSVGNAAESFIMSQVASFGSDMLIIRSGSGDGKQSSGPPTSVVKQTLTVKDYKRLKQQGWVRLASANLFNNVNVEYSSETIRSQIAGVAENGLVMYNAEVDRGSFFTLEDVDAKANIAVLGMDLAKDLFGEEDSLGKTIKISKRSYKVIGVLKPAGTRFFTNLDRQAYIPYTTMMEEFNMEHIQFINVKTGSVATNEAKERVRVLLRDLHRIDNPTGDLSKDDFFIGSQEDTAERAGAIGTILGVLLSSIAAISLIVGGVGIMNIMYVTVTERTREIGLRKAIGALYGDILRQFLYEALLLSVFAGLIGVACGVGLSWIGLKGLAAYQQGWTFSVPWSGVGMGFGVSVAIGIIFGYFPARKAAKLKPIEALRYE
ncbi:ABC transporter permease [Candidatus Uhrbacteria bacterium]|nr:ABC transporter permease [Candidatus Uhrbacteria bacterium]